MKQQPWNEKQMLSWQPRQISSKLEQKVFGAKPQRRATKVFLECMTPAAACALLTLFIWNHADNPANPGSAHGFNLSYLTNSSLVTNDPQSTRNNLMRVTFDSTNHSYFNSNIGFASSNNLSN